MSEDLVSDDDDDENHPLFSCFSGIGSCIIPRLTDEKSGIPASAFPNLPPGPPSGISRSKNMRVGYTSHARRLGGLILS